MPQLVVDKRKEMLSGRWITILDSREDLRDVSHRVRLQEHKLGTAD